MITEDGKIISWRHLRNEFGAVTACVRYEKNSPTMDIGFSFCSPEEKNFRKYSGRKRSLKRLLKDPIRISKHDGIVASIIGYLKDSLEYLGPYRWFVHSRFRIELYAPRGGGDKSGHFKMWFTKFAAALEILPQKGAQQSGSHDS